MKFWKNVGIATLSVCGLYFAHQSVNALMKAHNWVGLTPSDWGTWAGAVGTVATLIWTVRLATAQTRQKTKDDPTLARLHASMVRRLAHAQTVVADVCRMLDIGRQIQMGPEHCASMAGKLDSIDLWAVDELVPLVPLPSNTAAKLAQSADQIRTAQKVLRKAITNQSSTQHEE
jgi:hypothetical protein